MRSRPSQTTTTASHRPASLSCLPTTPSPAPVNCLVPSAGPEGPHRERPSQGHPVISRGDGSDGSNASANQPPGAPTVPGRNHPKRSVADGLCGCKGAPDGCSDTLTAVSRSSARVPPSRPPSLSAVCCLPMGHPLQSFRQWTGMLDRHQDPAIWGRERVRQTTSLQRPVRHSGDRNRPQAHPMAGMLNEPPSGLERR